MEEYIRLEEEKARERGKVFNWETAKYGKIWYDEDIQNLRSIETEFPAIAFNDQISSKKHSLMNLRLSIRHIQTPWIRRIDYLDVIQSLFLAQSRIQHIRLLHVSIRRILGNGYVVLTSCIGPREGKSTNVGEESTI
ncbi:hypothetical protein Tco_0064776 [Tanacetum coccineum]